MQAAHGQAVRGGLRAFKAIFPNVRNVVAWNEINHFTQPTYKNPKAAAKFTTIARKVFKGGTVVAADILDQADNTRAKQPTFRSATRYVKRFRKAYKGPRKVCGVHNYSDINRFRQTGTKAIIKALGCKQIWLTEAGGIYKFTVQGVAEAPAEGDEVHVQGRPQEQADQAALRLHLVRRRHVALRRRPRRQGQGAQGIRRGAQARQVALADDCPPHRRHGRADRGGGARRRRPPCRPRERRRPFLDVT